MFSSIPMPSRQTSSDEPPLLTSGNGIPLVGSSPSTTLMLTNACTAIIAVGTGGVWGKGLMNGVQKLFYLPEPHTDFIYSVIAEELGLIGATAVVLCFCVMTWRGLRIAAGAADPFGGYLALGLTTMIAAQAFVNISVVLGLMPTKGLPLPFVSAGGSSLLINLVGMGILLNVSQHTSSAEA